MKYSDSIKLEQIRTNELNALSKSLISTKKNSINPQQINNATPGEQKPQGVAKLSYIVTTFGNQIQDIIQPSLDNIINTLPKDGSCLLEIENNNIKNQRDDIVQSLNNSSRKINNIGSSITGVSNFLKNIIPILKKTSQLSDILSITTKLIPSPPGTPGVLVSGLNDIQTFIRKSTFDEYGNPKLSRSQGIISGTALSISMVGSYFLQATLSIGIIDEYIKRCSNDINLIPISDDTNLIVQTQTQSLETQNRSSYNGFIIEIIEIPYTPTVTRRKAVGKNNQDIILIETELSFTTNNEVLINELKLIIDRDNLKAY